jgi:hypothetical protein
MPLWRNNPPYCPQKREDLPPPEAMQEMELKDSVEGPGLHPEENLEDSDPLDAGKVSIIMEIMLEMRM